MYNIDISILGDTQVQLGIKLNIANNTIGQYEKGRRGTVSVIICFFICKAETIIR